MDDNEWNEWLAALPENVREEARKCRAKCYRLSIPGGQAIHLALMQWVEDSAGAVAVRVIEGADSTYPGLITEACDPAFLVPCDCGKWRQPTVAQSVATMKMVRAHEDKVRSEKNRLRDALPATAAQKEERPKWLN